VRKRQRKKTSILSDLWTVFYSEFAVIAYIIPCDGKIVHINYIVVYSLVLIANKMFYRMLAN